MALQGKGDQCGGIMQQETGRTREDQRSEGKTGDCKVISIIFTFQKFSGDIFSAQMVNIVGEILRLYLFLRVNNVYLVLRC